MNVKLDTTALRIERKAADNQDGLKEMAGEVLNHTFILLKKLKWS